MTVPTTSEPANEERGRPEDAPPRVAEVTTQIRGSSLLVFGRVLSLIVNVGIQVLLVRSLSKADFGVFAYALSVVTMIATLSTLGLDRGLSRFVAMYDEQGEKAKVWGTLILQVSTIVGIGLAAAALVIGLHGWIGENLVDDPKLATLLAVMVLLAPIQALDSMGATVFAAFSQSKTIFLRRYVLAPILRLVIVALLVATNGNLYVLGFGYVMAGLFGLALYGTMLVKTMRERGMFERGGDGRVGIDMPIAEISAFAVPLLATDAMFIVLNTSDVVILGRSAGASAVASYRAILPVARLNQIVMNSFALLFAPLMARLWSRGDRTALTEAYWQTAAWVTALTFPVFALTLGFASPLTVALFGSSYADSATYLRILCIAYYFNAVLGFNGVTVKMIGRVWLAAWNATAALAFNLAANLLLIPRYGALGAAWGTALSIAFYNVLKQWALRRSTGLAWFDRRYTALYASIGLFTIWLTVLDLSASSVAVRTVCVGAMTLIVLELARRALLVGELFPEMARIPLIGRFIVRTEEDR